MPESIRSAPEEREEIYFVGGFYGVENEAGQGPSGETNSCFIVDDERDFPCFPVISVAAPPRHLAVKNIFFHLASVFVPPPRRPRLTIRSAFREVITPAASRPFLSVREGRKYNCSRARCPPPRRKSSDRNLERALCQPRTMEAEKRADNVTMIEPRQPPREIYLARSLLASADFPSSFALHRRGTPLRGRMLLQSFGQRNKNRPPRFDVPLEIRTEFFGHSARFNGLGGSRYSTLALVRW